MLSHTEARAIICEGYQHCYSDAPTRPQAQLAQSVGYLETSYTSGWSSSIPGAAESLNWGAITAGTEWHGATFEHKDSRPDAQGNNVWYTTKFRSYPSLEAGAEDLIRVVYQQRPKVLAAATAGDSLAFSQALYDSKYYLGFGSTPEERIAHHHAAVLNACRLMALEIGELMPDGSTPTPLPLAALHQGVTGPRVEAWQRVLNAAGFVCTVDGVFGPKTRTLTMLLQKKLGVAMDGVVGPATQAAAAAAGYP